MATSTDLDEVLSLLISKAKQAQQIIETKLRIGEELDPDEELDFDGEHRIWLALEEDITAPHVVIAWACGWRMHTDESTVWMLKAVGRTPFDAAQALVGRLGGQT